MCFIIWQVIPRYGPFQAIPAVTQCNESWDEVDKQFTDIMNTHVTVVDYFDENRDALLGTVSKM